MKKFVTIFALLLFLGTNALYAQPQTERIRKEIKQKGATAHLLTEMARIFSTSHPDSAIRYAKLAQAKNPTGTDLMTLYAALGEANMAQGKTKEALQLCVRHEAAIGRDGVNAVVFIGFQHLLGFLKPDIAQPNTECDIKAAFDIDSESVARLATLSLYPPILHHQSRAASI